MAFPSAYFPASYFTPRYWPRGNDPLSLSTDFLRAVQRAIVENLPAPLEPVYDGSKPVRGDVWEGAVPNGVRPPYAQIVDLGATLQKIPGLQVTIRRQSFRISVFARDRDEVLDIAEEIQDVLDARVVYFQGGRVLEPIHVESLGPRTDTTGTGPGGRNVWRKDDTYRAFLIKDT